MTAKYKLVPADVLEQTLQPSTRTLINMDKEMQRLLKNKKLSPEERYIKYMTVFAGYLRQRNNNKPGTAARIHSVDVVKKQPSQVPISVKPSPAWHLDIPPSETELQKSRTERETPKNIRSPYSLRARLFRARQKPYDYVIKK